MSKTRKEDGRHDYDGECKPSDRGIPRFGGQVDFSVAIFKWEPRKSGGLKRGKAIYRIIGPVCRPESVYRRAEEICHYLDAGGKLEKKSERVR